MRAEIAFRRQGVVDVDAAVVGISRSRWGSVGEDTSEDDAKRTMAENGFDVLPIEQRREGGGPGACKACFTTATWGDYTKIVHTPLRHSDVIPFNTPLRDVIRQLAVMKRSFFFLADEGDVAGLITVANLNCRQVSVFLFGLLVELEVRLGQTVRAHYKDELEAAIRTVCAGERAQDIFGRFESDRAGGVDAPLIEYVYLSDLLRLLLKDGLYERFGCSRKDFKERMGALVDLRNQVAHPTRSLIDGNRTVERLWKRLDNVDAMLFALR